MALADTFLMRGTEAVYRALARTSPIRVAHHLNEKLANQWLPHAQLRQLQWRRLQRMLHHCHAHVPFYRELWTRHHVDPTRFTRAEQLRELPPVTRDILTQARLDGAFTGANGTRQQLLATSGTTRDRRFQVAIGFEDYQRKYANHLRQLYVPGWRLGMRSAALHNSGHGHFKGRYGGERTHREPWHRWRDLALSLAHRRQTPVPYRPAFSGDESIVARWYRDLKQHAPVLLDAFYMNVLMLQDYIDRERLEPLSIPILFVLHSLTPAGREELRRTVGTRVLNRYSPHECEGIAVACESGRGMHVAIDSYVVEVVNEQENEARAGEIGRMLITDLENYAMPLIRYDIGDLGFSLDEPCPCGRGFPLIGDLEGRRQEALRNGTGTIVTPAQLERIFQADPTIRFFQVLGDDTRVRVDVVPRGDGPTTAATDRYAAQLRALLGDTIAIEIRGVDRVRFERNGKYSFVRNVSGRQPEP